VLALWSEFCRGLEAAGAALATPYYPGDPAAQADGVKHLATMTQEALHWYLEADPDFPRFITLNDTNVLADNRFAAVRSDAAYLLTGNVDRLFDVNVSLHEGWPFLGQTKVWGDIGMEQLDVDDDGNLNSSSARRATIGPTAGTGSSSPPPRPSCTCASTSATGPSTVPARSRSSGSAAKARHLAG
jgi:hypothetical protein